MSHREVRLNSRRLLIATAIAVALHAGLFFLIPLVAHLEGSRKPEYGGTVLVQLEEPTPAQVVVPAPEPPPVVQPVPAPKPAPVLKPAPRTQPAARTTPAVKAPEQAAAKVPTPPAPLPATPAMPTGPAFKEAGGKTGIVQPLAAPEPLGSTPVAQAVPGPEPTLPGAGVRSGAATAGASVQSSGVAVPVPAPPAKPAGTSSGSSLDLGALDKALAGSAKPGATAGKAAADAAAEALNSLVDWDEPDAGKGRDLLSAPLPNLPQWVADQGLALAVTVSFAVAPNGVVAQARVARSSGYSDVDAAVLEAVRRWRFRSAETARTVRGAIPYTIRAR